MGLCGDEQLCVVMSSSWSSACLVFLLWSDPPAAVSVFINRLWSLWLILDVSHVTRHLWYTQLPFYSFRIKYWTANTCVKLSRSRRIRFIMKAFTTSGSHDSGFCSVVVVVTYPDALAAQSELSRRDWKLSRFLRKTHFYILFNEIFLYDHILCI